jgi:metallo-beta-lactamase family protein
MKIHFLGAAQTVTGSQHLLEVNGHFLLLDCGMFQGRRQEAYEVNRNFLYDPAQVEAVILSHAHIDHCGNLPNLVKKGFHGQIYTSHISRHLVPILLADSGHIQEADVEYVNKKRDRDGKQQPIKPLYTVVDAERVEPYLQKVDYNQPFEPIPGVTARLVDAGHILGSAAAVLDITEKGSQFRLWFSGDIGRARLPIVNDPVLPNQADYLMMESTYGDTLHESADLAYENLKKVAARTLERGGKLIIPAFAVGRTQDLVYSFNRMFEAREAPRVPVYVDSPLAVRVSQVFRDHPEFFDKEATDFAKTSSAHAALGFQLLTYVQSVEESKAINNIKRPIIIISASGMLETGRILHHLAHNIGDPRSTILLVSYQAPNTLGRRLVEGEKTVKIYGEIFECKAEVVNLDGFSAHAGQDALVKYASSTRGTVKEIFLVHGEPDAAEVLRAKLAEAGMPRVQYPARKQVIEIPT